MWSASLPSQNPFVTTPRHRSLHTEFHSPNIHPPSPGTRRNRSHPWNRLGRPWPCHGAVSSSGPAAEAAAGCGTRPASRGAPDPVGAMAATRGTGSGAEAAPGGAASLVDYMKSRGVSPKSLRSIFLRLQKLVEFWNWRSSEELLLIFWGALGIFWRKAHVSGIPGLMAWHWHFAFAACLMMLVLSACLTTRWRSSAPWRRWNEIYKWGSHLFGGISGVPHTLPSISQRIGWWENLQETPIFDGKNHGFL